jgi:hypothetical protein
MNKTRIAITAALFLIGMTEAANAGPLIAAFSAIAYTFGLSGIGGSLFALSGFNVAGFAAGAAVVQFLGSPVGSLRPAKLERSGHGS